MSATLETAIQNQLTNRTKRNSEGKLLCRRCSKVVPPEYSVVFWDPEDETKVWGPCCSDECICHLKICSECNQDFIIDREGEITHVGSGIWLCKHCIRHVEICPCCNNKSPLVDSPSGKMCKNCFNRKYFICKDCGKIKETGEAICNLYDRTEMAKWSHIVDQEERRKVCNDCYSLRKVGKEPLPVAACKYCDDTFTLHSKSSEYCIRCIDRGYVQSCTRCGVYAKRFDEIDGHYYCKTCAPKVIPCAMCGKGLFKEEGFKVRGKSSTYLVCNKCKKGKKVIQECPSCMKPSASPLLKVPGKKDACSKCISLYNYCTECEQYHFNEGYCRKDRAKVMDYSYKPFPYFNGDLNDRVFFGFENEINYPEDSYEEARSTVIRSYPSEVLYAKRDGSIQGHGFELVSHPMSFDFFKGLDLEPMFRVKPKERDTSCGLHVHISRKAFDGQTHLFKLTEFINNNRTFTKKVAGRDFNSYAREYQEKISKAVKGTGFRERYHAVNLTNKHTVEIRIFKSARNEFQLRYRIEFVNALLEYTRNSSLKDLKDSLFKEWLKAGSGYSELKKFLKLN